MARRQRLFEALLLLSLSLPTVACDSVLGIDDPVARANSSAGDGNGTLLTPDPVISSAGGASRSVSGLSGNNAGTGGGTEDPAGLGGEAGTQGPSASPLQIEGADTSACPGAAVVVHLAASGGEAPYVWHLLSGGPNFALGAPGEGDGTRINLTGSTASSGAYPLKVQVTDAQGKRAERTVTISVAAAPQIVPPELLSACPGQVYSTELKATGGDSKHYRWSVSGLPETSGLKLDQGVLAGTFVRAPDSPAHLDLTIALDDGGSCPVQPVKVTLPVESPSATACATIELANNPPGTPLPAACLGNPYEQALVAHAGMGPYEWSAIAPLPSGLLFDASAHRLSGFMLSAEPLTLQLRDLGTGRTIRSTFDLKPRDKCWLAYVSKETGSARLHFFDALLGNRKTLPPDSVSDAVTDFQFSPNGQYLAYRLGSSAALSIVKLQTWQEDSALFQHVTHYAWSLDSKILAVAFDSDNGPVLGGADVGHELSSGPNNPYNPSAISFPQLLTTPTAVDADLVWFDGPHLAFLKMWDDPDYFPTFTQQIAGHFDAPYDQEDYPFSSDSHLIAGTKGVFSIPASGVIAYYGSDGSLPVPHNNVLLAPSGLYTARTQSHQLSLFRALDKSIPIGARPRDQKEGCDTILAWASGTERIACALQVPDADDKLHIFDIDTQSDLLTAALDVPLSEPNPDTAHIARRRLFSHSGALFAFSADDRLSIAALASGSPASVRSVPLSSSAAPPNNAFAELSFSADEQMLLQHRGTRLSFFDLRRAALIEVVASSQLAPSLSCSENTRIPGAGGWCGSERQSAPFRWGPLSDIALFQLVDGTLQIYDVRYRKAGLFGTIPVNNQCGQDCLIEGQLAFQP